MVELFDILKELKIKYERVKHPPVFTCEEAERLVPEIEGVETKNLFLRDKKGKKHFLLVASADKQIDLKVLSEQIASTKLSFASPERLEKYLGVSPGSVSVLAVINDKNNDVTVLIDRDIPKNSKIKCHPLVNTETLSIAYSDIELFLGEMGHVFRVV